jgi:hypothetical protein
MILFFHEKKSIRVALYLPLWRSEAISKSERMEHIPNPDTLYVVRENKNDKIRPGT